MVQDNKLRLSSQFLERAIFSLWSLDLLEYIKTKAALSKNFHIQPSEVDKMVYWEFEYFVKALNELVKAENDEQKDQMDKSDYNKYKNMNPNSFKYNAPKMPNININAGGKF